MTRVREYFDLAAKSQRVQHLAAQAPLMALQGTPDNRRGLALLIADETAKLTAMLRDEASAPIDDATDPRCGA